MTDWKARAEAAEDEASTLRAALRDLIEAAHVFAQGDPMVSDKGVRLDHALDRARAALSEQDSREYTVVREGETAAEAYERAFGPLSEQDKHGEWVKCCTGVGVPCKRLSKQESGLSGTAGGVSHTVSRASGPAESEQDEDEGCICTWDEDLGGNVFKATDPNCPIHGKQDE